MQRLFVPAFLLPLKVQQALQQFYNKSGMIKTPNNSYKKLLNIKLYSLSIYDIQFTPQMRKANVNFTFSVYGLDEGLIKQSPILYGNTHQTWQLIVNLPNPKITFYSQTIHGNKRKYQLGSAVLQMQKNIMGVQSISGKLICQLNYDIQQNNKNSFQNNTNIFEDIGEERPLKLHNKIHHPTLDITYQRKPNYEPDQRILELSAEQREEQFRNRNNYEDQRTVMMKVGEASRLLEDSMKKSEEERRIFSRYLDQSTSYINELMSHLQQQKPILDKSNFSEISAIKEEKDESDEELRTQQKWYKRKFHKSYLKQKSQLRKPKNIKVSQQGLKKIKVDFFDEKESKSNIILKMVSDFVIESKEKVKEIVIFNEDKNGKRMKDLVKISRQDGKLSNSWPIQIPLPSNNPINIRCIYEKYEYMGCIGKNEQKIGECELFDQKGIVKGMLHFKAKCVSDFVIQTQDLLPAEIEEKICENLNQTSSPQSTTQHNSPLASKKDTIQHVDKDKVSPGYLTPIKALSMKPKGLDDSGDRKQEQRNATLMDTKETEKPSFNPRLRGMIQETSLEESKQQYNQPAYSQDRLKLNLKKCINEEDPEQIKPKSKRLYESQAMHLNLISPRHKKISLKITSIDVRLERANLHGKFLKMQMSTQPIPYYTETTKQLCFLNWKGRGYLFINIPPTSILTLSLVEETQAQMSVMGTCKIHLNLLNTQYLGVNSYEDYLRDQKQQSIGKIVLQFQFFEKNNNDLQAINTRFNSGRKSNKKSKQSRNKSPGIQQSDRYKNLYTRLVESTVERGKHQGKKFSHIRIKSEQSKGNYPRKIQSIEHIFDRVQKDPSKSTVKIRKYMGGNIIIPRAARFKTSEGESVGPGTYEYQSQFQRHTVVQ